jgi:hypothetical protein
LIAPGWGERVLLRSSHTVLLHDLKELDNDLAGGPDHNLPLATLLGIVDAVEGIVEDGGADHFGGWASVEILKSSKKRGICQEFDYC